MHLFINLRLIKTHRSLSYLKLVQNYFILFYPHRKAQKLQTHRCLNQKQPFWEYGLTLRATEAMSHISAIPVSSSAHD